jgi:DNA-binding MarR family transcriptional regulator
LITQLYDSYLSEHGIESAQFALLMMLDALPDKGQTALAQATGMDKTTLSRNVKVLRGYGWLDSEEGSDARSRNLILTEEGRAVLEKARPAWRRAHEALRREVGVREWPELLSTLHSLAASAVVAGGRR